MGEVTANFLSGLALALSLDGTQKRVGFSDGSGVPNSTFTRLINVLWLTDAERIVRTHSHGTNYLMWNEGITLVMFASDVPAGAALAANCYLDVEGKQFRVENAFIENEIWQVQLQVFRTSMK